MTKPTLLFLHGSWHTFEVWERVRPLLEEKEYKCIAPQCIFCGTEEPVRSIAPCITQIQDIIAEETSAGRDVVLINHSFGGIVGCSAVNGFTVKNPSRLATGADTGKVIGIVQVTALTIPSNMSLAQIQGDAVYDIAVPGPDGWDVPVENDANDPTKALYNDLEPEDAQYWISKIVKNSSASRFSSENVYAGWTDVPVWYVRCTKDKALPPEGQEMMIGAIRQHNPSVTVRHLEASHSPMLSRPKEMVEIIDEAATAFAST